jgi:hypothetical protein
MADAMTIHQIEARRVAMKIPISRLCAAAGYDCATFYAVRAGRKQPQASTLAKLQLALKRFQTGFGGEASAIAPHAAVKGCIALAAFYLGADIRAVLNAEPGRRATANPEWMQAAQARRLGLWIANQWFGFKQSDLARAAGMTKQAVQAAVSELEWERDGEGGDNRDLDRVMRRIEEDFSA